MAQLHKGKSYPRATPIDLGALLWDEGTQPGYLKVANVSTFATGIIDVHIGTGLTLATYSQQKGKGSITYTATYPPFAGFAVEIEIITQLYDDGTPPNVQMLCKFNSIAFIDRRWLIPPTTAINGWKLFKANAYSDTTSNPVLWEQNNRCELEVVHWPDVP